MSDDFLFVVPSLTTLGGGVELHNRTLVERIAAVRPHAALHVVARHEPGRTHGRVGFAARTIAAALRTRPSIVMCGHPHHAPIALVAARLVGARCIAWAHGIEAWRVRGRWTRAALDACDRVVSVSRYTDEALARQGIASAATRRVIGNAIETAHSASAGVAPADSLLAGLQRPHLLSVTRLDPTERYKGIDEVLDALPHLRSPASYIVVGDGADRARLEARGGGARFLGKVDDATLRALYRSADLFVLPSVGEGFGYVFVEALASGLPVIAADAGGATETLAGLGVLVKPHDRAALVAAIDAQLAGNIDRARLATEATRRFGLARLDADLDVLLREL